MYRAPDGERVSDARFLISRPVPVLWPLLELSQRDDYSGGRCDVMREILQENVDLRVLSGALIVHDVGHWPN